VRHRQKVIGLERLEDLKLEERHPSCSDLLPNLLPQKFLQGLLVKTLEVTLGLKKQQAQQLCLLPFRLLNLLPRKINIQKIETKETLTLYRNHELPPNIRLSALCIKQNSIVDVMIQLGHSLIQEFLIHIIKKVKNLFLRELRPEIWKGFRQLCVTPKNQKLELGKTNYLIMKINEM
jgi:hypothetical protein